MSSVKNKSFNFPYSVCIPLFPSCTGPFGMMLNNDAEKGHPSFFPVFWEKYPAPHH